MLLKRDIHVSIVLLGTFFFCAIYTSDHLEYRSLCLEAGKAENVVT